jgi:CubicO group peptidase (beta-lactamase class C family)
MQPDIQAEEKVTDYWQSLLATAQSLPRLHSLLISRDGKLLQERYFNGKKATDIANVKSVSKSVVSALVGIAIEQQHIVDIDQPIGDFFAKELKSTPDKAQITIGNLLSMQSGLESTSNRHYGRWVLSDHWINFALQQPFEDQANGVMIYSTGNTHLLSAIVTNSSGINTLEFARRYLFSPMHIQLAPWPRDPQGIYFGGNDMELTPRQMLAFGELYLNGGRYEKKQLIPSQWIETSIKPRVASPRGQGRHYGYGWWIRDTAGFETPYAWGYGGQFILLVPDEKIVVVVTSNSNPGDDRRYHTRAAYRLVEQAVLAATMQ